MYLRPHYLKNAPRPPGTLPQIQDGGQKSNVAAEIHKIVFLRVPNCRAGIVESPTAIRAESTARHSETVPVGRS